MSGTRPTASERFAARMKAIEGVEQFVLVRKDGRIITHNLEDPDELAALATLCGLQAESIAQALGFTPMDYQVLQRDSGKNVSVFRLDKYFVGVIQQADSPLEELIDRVTRFLRSLRRTRQSA
ncbi:MAG: roadblock/LC7 domain-containing protein [Deltaproteobacteria bacterium]|nr:MAG: roadblock/LC7 domain-containing protein [Deltaproteobacteria bacterium]